MLSASAAAAALLGSSQHALLGSSLRQALCSERCPQSQEAWAQLERQLQAGQVGAAQMPLSLPGGGTGHVHLSVSALPRNGAAEQRYAWAVSPCGPSPAPTPQQQQQQQPPAVQLLPIETAALRVLPQPVWVCTADGRVAFANPACCHVAGCSEASAVGQPWMQLLLLQPQQDAAVVQHLAAAMAAGQPAQGNVKCCGGFTGRVSISPLPADGGRPPLLVCTLLGEPRNCCVAPAPAITSTSSSMAAKDSMPLPYAAALSATAAAEAAGGAVPPSVAQLCNQALASTSESVVITNPALPHNPIIYANQAFESLTGKPPSTGQLAYPRGSGGCCLRRLFLALHAGAVLLHCSF